MKLTALAHFRGHRKAFSDWHKGRSPRHPSIATVVMTNCETGPDWLIRRFQSVLGILHVTGHAKQKDGFEL